jgi:hypothetical protein
VNADEQLPDEAGEPGGMSERTARAVLVAVACGAMWGIVAVVPEAAYVVVGVFGCLGWQKARAWVVRRSGAEPDEDQAAEEPDVVGALQHLGCGGQHVLLTELRDELGLANTKAVRALLGDHGVRVREGVRAPAGNGPGVHRDDIPTPSPDRHSEGCCCTSDANTNANNGSREGPGEGLRVERIGTDGYIVYDPAEAVRHHRVL